MFKVFYPYTYINSVFSPDYENLFQQGYRALIFDIDNTLVHHGSEVTQEIIDLFEMLHQIGFRTLLLSNNNAKRIAPFAETLNTLFIADAHKPNSLNYMKALDLLEITPQQVLVVGDQIFTDIFGANRAGIASILVRFLQKDPKEPIGKKRQLEKLILTCFQYSRYRNRIEIKPKEAIVRRRNFSDINSLFYQISRYKEIAKRYVSDLRAKTRFARFRNIEKLPILIYSHSSNIIRNGPGIDPISQQNKAVNLALASEKINGIVIKPNEVFSFWHLVGKTSVRKGYKEGRVISKGKLKMGVGGGLCNLANTLNLLVLHSPLEIIELHTYSDALDPGAERNRLPFSSGTSVSYNYIDYRFKNNTPHDMQILVWCENGELKAELRSTVPVEHRYQLIEENHCFVKRGSSYYRHSEIYQQIICLKTDKVLAQKLIWKNRSKVMYDPCLIPKELIK